VKKFLTILLALLMVASLGTAALAEGKVGVSMPTQSLQRWNEDGANMQSQLGEAGYEVIVQFANNDVATQVSQIENMLLDEVDILVISAIDGSALGTVLAIAKDAGVPVICYDRLILATDAVNYYATFDNYVVGQFQGLFVETSLGLADRTAENPINLEFVAGDPADNNALYFYQGAYDVIAPYLESGVVKIPSGQVSFEQVATAQWDSAKAQSRVDDLIAANYTGDTKLDAVLCSNDSTALGAVNALKNAGFTLENFPVVTGQDCDKANMPNIIAGYQSMSVFKDTRALAAKVIEIVNAILAGEEVEVNGSYPNGVFDVPTYILDPQFADSENYYELLIASGYYTEEDNASWQAE
jgi:putative multiple sugar transport system substrate-binding protein